MISGLTGISRYDTVVACSSVASTKGAGEFQQKAVEQAPNASVLDAISKRSNTPLPQRKKATDEDIAELAEKYNPVRMSQKEYDAFLGDLMDRGIIAEEDLGRLGYLGLFACGIDDGSGEPQITVYDTPTVGDMKGLGVPYYDPEVTDPVKWFNTGNRLAYAKYMARQKPSSASSQTAFDFAADTYSAFSTVADILQAMQSQRGDEIPDCDPREVNGLKGDLLAQVKDMALWRLTFSGSLTGVNLTGTIFDPFAAMADILDAQQNRHDD